MLACAHDQIINQRRCEETVAGHTRSLIEPSRQLFSVRDRTVVISEDAAVRSSGDIRPKRDVAELLGRGPQAKQLQLEGDRRTQDVDELVRGDDDDETVGGPGDNLLP